MQGDGDEEKVRKRDAASSGYIRYILLMNKIEWYRHFGVNHLLAGLLLLLFFPNLRNEDVLDVYYLKSHLLQWGQNVS